MTIGVGTYAFFWQWQTTAAQPLSLTEMIDKAARWDVTLFQICDYPLIETFDDSALAALRRHANNRGSSSSSVPADYGPSTSPGTCTSPRPSTSRWSAA